MNIENKTALITVGQGARAPVRKFRTRERRGSRVMSVERTGNKQQGEKIIVKTSMLVHFVSTISMLVAIAQGQAPKYPPIEQYLMSQAEEIALAKSAAPANISDRATIEVLTRSGFEVAQHGDNGSVCMVMWGFSAPTYTPAQFRNLVYDPTVRAPICFTPPAVRSVMPYYVLRTNLAMQGKSPDEIAEGVAVACAQGKLPRRDEVSIAYMWSARQNLASGIGHWHPHVMIFVPYYDNSMVGGNPFGSPLPQLTDDAGTPFSVVVVPVDDKLAIAGEMK
jgi:hypothetical protein